MGDVGDKDENDVNDNNDDVDDNTPAHGKRRTYMKPSTLIEW